MRHIRTPEPPARGGTFVRRLGTAHIVSRRVLRKTAYGYE